MANKEDIALMAHLMRRASFGATRDEIETYVERGYEQTVDDLVDANLLMPEEYPPKDEYMMYRYHPITDVPGAVSQGQAPWMFRMLFTKQPLQEKMVLFWHQIFCTGNSKIDNTDTIIEQTDMFREHSLGNYKTLITELAKNPAMIFYLDNQENSKRAPNENWGRELLELFSMGVGNYTETDVYECSRAFTGWTIGRKIPRFPLGRFRFPFEYRPEEHDYTEKTFLGQTGRFNGEDVIDIIVQHPACPRFITRHMYNFFVADEAQVPAWNIEPPRDPEAIKTLSEVFVESEFEIKPVLKTLFNSDFFKESMYQKVKSPVEVVTSTLRLTKDIDGPDPMLESTTKVPGYMGQDFLNPPSVEGWHTGREWINSGSLVKRINFVADRVSNPELPGVQSMISRVAGGDTAMTAEALVDRCLDQMGPLEVSESTRCELVNHAESEGPISWSDEKGYASFSRRVGDIFALIAATREYQFG